MDEKLNVEKTHKNSENHRSNALTSIRDAYTLAATPENADELDEIIVKHFLSTLAEVAMTIASRKTKQETGC